MKSILGLDGLLVSDTGNLVRESTGRLIRPFVINRGYEAIKWPSEGRLRTFTVHRLVAMAFIPNPDCLPQVNHKDGNKRNNRVENLEWVTASQNMRHALDVLGIHLGQPKLTVSKIVRAISLRTHYRNLGKRFPRKRLAKEWGVSPSAISQALDGDTWSRSVTAYKQ